MREKCRACAGSGWYDATDQNGNGIPCAACNGTGYEDGESEEIAELKLDLISARSRLVDVEKALELACKTMAEYIEVCQGELEKELPTEVCPEPCCNDAARCW